LWCDRETWEAWDNSFASARQSALSLGSLVLGARRSRCGCRSERYVSGHHL